MTLPPPKTPPLSRDYPAPAVNTTPACWQCHSPQLIARADPITTKRRPKFGILWLTLIALTGGLAIVAYLAWPRHTQTIAIDRYWQCTNCGARQPG